MNFMKFCDFLKFHEFNWYSFVQNINTILLSISQKLLQLEARLEF